MSSTERSCRRLYHKQVRASWNAVIRKIIASLQQPNLPHLTVMRGMRADDFHPKASSLL